MSADNRICIMRDQWGQWRVWNGSGSATYGEPPSSAQAFETETEAREYAFSEEERIEHVEYGVQVIGVDEQREALTMLVEDAGRRLKCLNETGAQWPEFNA